MTNLSCIKDSFLNGLYLVLECRMVTDVWSCCQPVQFVAVCKSEGCSFDSQLKDVSRVHTKPSNRRHS
jgi:hypothetical protein